MMTAIETVAILVAIAIPTFALPALALVLARFFRPQRAPRTRSKVGRITADTITDDQIRKLNATAWKAEHIMSSATALGYQSESYPGHVRDARARCAEILNANDDGTL